MKFNIQTSLDEEATTFFVDDVEVGYACLTEDGKMAMDSMTGLFKAIAIELGAELMYTSEDEPDELEVDDVVFNFDMDD